MVWVQHVADEVLAVCRHTPVPGKGELPTGHAAQHLRHYKGRGTLWLTAAPLSLAVWAKVGAEDTHPAVGTASHACDMTAESTPLMHNGRQVLAFAEPMQLYQACHAASLNMAGVVESLASALRVHANVAFCVPARSSPPHGSYPPHASVAPPPPARRQPPPPQRGTYRTG